MFLILGKTDKPLIEQMDLPEYDYGSEEENSSRVFKRFSKDSNLFFRYLLSDLEKAKKKWYKKLSSDDFKKTISNLLFKREDEDNEDYLIRIKRLVIFDILKNRPAFLYFIFLNTVGHKITKSMRKYFNERQ